VDHQDGGRSLMDGTVRRESEIGSSRQKWRPAAGGAGGASAAWDASSVVLPARHIEAAFLDSDLPARVVGTERRDRRRSGSSSAGRCRSRRTSRSALGVRPAAGSVVFDPGRAVGTCRPGVVSARGRRSTGTGGSVFSASSVRRFPAAWIVPAVLGKIGRRLRMVGVGGPRGFDPAGLVGLGWRRVALPKTLT
jgi:hypothetical protein